MLLMEWCKLYARYPADGAIHNVGEDGEVLFFRSIAWSTLHDTIGHIPAWQLPCFGLKNVEKRATKLVAEKLWTEVDGGWLITNYEKLQAEVTSQEKRRKADRLRKQSKRRAEKSADMSARKSEDIPPDASRISPVVDNGRDENRETRTETSALGLLPSQNQRDVNARDPIGIGS